MLRCGVKLDGKAIFREEHSFDTCGVPSLWTAPSAARGAGPNGPPQNAVGRSFRDSTLPEITKVVIHHVSPSLTASALA